MVVNAENERQLEVGLATWYQKLVLQLLRVPQTHHVMHPHLVSCPWDYPRISQTVQLQPRVTVLHNMYMWHCNVE
jgi:hypothetical protein